MEYNEAAAEMKWLLEQIDWSAVVDVAGTNPYRDANAPSIDLTAFDYSAPFGFNPVEEPAVRNPGDTERRKTDWIALSRVGGQEVQSMDGFSGISKQAIRVSAFSDNRERTSLMADEIRSKLDNFTGMSRASSEGGLEFQCCFLDEAFDTNDEESGIRGMDMFFLVVVSG